MKRRYALALLCVIPVLAHAQAPPDRLREQESIFVRNSISADGATNPGLIPFGVAAEMAFFGFRRQLGQPDNLRQNLRTRFGGNDADSLFQLAAGAQQFAEDVRNEEGRSLDASCAKLVSAEPWNSIDALQMAKEFAAIENRRIDLIEQHYKAAFDGLSASARSALLRYLDTDVRPRMQWSKLDIVGVATEVPEDWLYNQRLSCERRLALPLSDRTWKVTPPRPMTVN